MRILNLVNRQNEMLNDFFILQRVFNNLIDYWVKQVLFRAWARVGASDRSAENP